MTDLELSKLADVCVKCGICLQSCPTYQVSHHECESPRGRISIIKSLGLGEISLTAKAKEHLNQCLHCLRCEVVCPAKVPYEQIINKAKANYFSVSFIDGLRIGILTEKRPRTFFKYALLQLKRLFNAFPLLFKLFDYGMFRHGLSLLKKIDPVRSSAKKSSHPTPSLMRKNWREGDKKHSQTAQTDAESIEIFIDCGSHYFGESLVQDLEYLLERLQVKSKRVGDGCCGEISRHAGLKPKPMPQLKSKVCLTLNSGCKLKKTVNQPTQIMNAVTFLLEKKDFLLKPDNRVVMWISCSNQEAHYQNSKLWPYRTLKGLGCCGASGDRFVMNPNGSQVFLEPVLDQLSGVQTILCPNLSCAIHLELFFKAHVKENIKVIHPISWLAAGRDSDIEVFS